MSLVAKNQYNNNNNNNNNRNSSYKIQSYTARVFQLSEK